MVYRVDFAKHIDANSYAFKTINFLYASQILLEFYDFNYEKILRDGVQHGSIR